MWIPYGQHSIEELELSARVYNALWNDDKRTVEQVQTFSDAEMLRIPNFGKMGLAELKGALKRWSGLPRDMWTTVVLPQPDPQVVVLARLLEENLDLLKKINNQLAFFVGRAMDWDKQQ